MPPEVQKLADDLIRLMQESGMGEAWGRESGMSDACMDGPVP